MTSDMVIPTYDKKLVPKWTDAYSELLIHRYSQTPATRLETMAKWQAFVDYLCDGGEAYIVYSQYGAMSGSIGRITFDGPTRDISDILLFNSYDIALEPVFKITFDETRSVDFIKFRSGLATKMQNYGFRIVFKKPEHCYLTTSTYYKKQVAKSNIVYDRYGTQITTGCYVLAAMPSKPPSIEAGKIVNVTDSGIIWFKRLGQESVLKGTLRAKSCVVITEDLPANILMEKLST